MKKVTLIILSAFCSLALLAQNNTEEVKAPKKDYSALMPQAGTIAIGADAAQFIRFLGAQTFGRINGPVNERTPVIGYQGDIFSKYFISEKLALRSRLTLNFNNWTNKEFVRDDYQFFMDPLSNDLTVDQHKYKDGMFELGIGGECRRSLWRVQGYAGAEVFFGYGYEKESFEYGNSITDMNQNPTSYNFGNNLGQTYYGRNYYRILSQSNNKIFTYGASVFVGADYFFSRNLSLGLEFAYQARGTFYGETDVIGERWDNNRHETNQEFKMPTQTSFRFLPQGFLNLMFYF